jgi:hypothetical protein
MPPISHNYLNKLRREVAAFSDWLASTEADEDGSARVDDLYQVFTKANSIYLKALALYRTTADDADEPRGEQAGEATLSGG